MELFMQISFSRGGSRYATAVLSTPWDYLGGHAPFGTKILTG